jgi:hypothetical protein
MEVSQNKKLITKDMARVDRDNGDVQLLKDRESPPRDQVGLTHANRLEGEELNPLLSTDEEKDFRSRWQNIQIGFVDEPRQAVQQADELVAEIMQDLAQSFSVQRSHLESQWEHSDKISTEELRMALRRYRSFFDRLLSI